MNKNILSTLTRSILGTISLGLVACSTPAGPSSTGNAAPTRVKQYTSDKCIVSDNKLGSMGDPVSYVHNGQEVKFCCTPCIKKFKANPDKYLAKLN